MKKLIFITICSIWLSGCGDFLKEQSQQYVYASSCSDLDEILIGSVYMQGELSTYAPPSEGNGINYPWLSVLDDDSEEYVRDWDYGTGSPIMVFRPFYGWFREPLLSKKTEAVLEDNTWQWLYTATNYANVVISQVDEYQQDPEDTRRRVKGEALFLRAAYYYLLNNIYAKPYVRGTAETDLGVPLKISEYVEDKYYDRASNAKVYAQIIEDLKNAAENLSGIQQKTIYRVNEAAVRTLLSRVYLYMGEWQSCVNECDKVMELGCTLWDLNNLKVTDDEGTRDFVLSTASPEVFFTQGGSIVSILMESNIENSGTYCVSRELEALYHKYEQENLTDLRAKAYLKALTGVHSGHYYVRKSPASPNRVNVFDAFVLRAAEVYLNKAEAEAMLDQPEARKTLKVLLESRFAGHRIPDVDGLSGENLVKFIREERRRELCFECHRWFDLRRYAVSSKYAEIKRLSHKLYSEAVNPPQVQHVMELGRYGEDGGWVMPIPHYEIEFNKGALKQNEERPNRHI